MSFSDFAKLFNYMFVSGLNVWGTLGVSQLPQNSTAKPLWNEFPNSVLFCLGLYHVQFVSRFPPAVYQC